MFNYSTYSWVIQAVEGVDNGASVRRRCMEGIDL